MLYAPYISPTEKKLRERLKAARSRIERQACRRDRLPAVQTRPAQVAEPTSDPVKIDTWVERQKRLWFSVEKDLGPVGQVTISLIKEVVCAHYGISHDDLTCHRRQAVLVLPRQVAMYLAKTLTSRSYPEISRMFGGRDHTTLMYAVRKIEALIAADPALAETIRVLTAKIKGDDHEGVASATDRRGEGVVDGHETAKPSPHRDGIDVAGFDGPATQVRKSQTTEA